MTWTFEPYVEFCRRRAAFFRKVAIGIAVFGSALFAVNLGVDLATDQPFIHTSRISSLICVAGFLGAGIALYLDLRASLLDTE